MERSLAKILPSLSRFRREEDGSLTIMALFFFICMIMIGGLSVDIMVFENNRTRLQNLTDRAVLAAADMEQSGDPESIVRSYFEKAGMADQLDDVRVTDGLLARSVSVQTSNPMRTMFMNMTGVTQMTPRASASAAEGTEDLEIVLVLDVSNSMNNPSSAAGMPTKLDDMKNAAKRFVDVVFSQSESDNITITLVPYNTQVNAGRSVLAAMGVQTNHDRSHCIEFDAADFSSPVLDLTKEYEHTAHFDQWYRSEDPVVTVCRSGANQEIKLHQNDPETIKAQIDALSAHGNTSAEIGMKWAASLLDPSSRPLTATLASSGEVPASMADRPLDYDTDGSRKIIVLLTDGINTDQKRINSRFLRGVSPVYETITSGALDTYSANMRSLWNTANPANTAENFWAKGDSILGYTWEDTWTQTPVLPLLQTGLGIDPYGERRLTWAELWQVMNPRHLAREYVADATNNPADEQAFLDQLWTNVNGATKDTRLLAMCDDMRNEGVTVYTVGFEINAHAQDIMGRCASNKNTFVNVVGDDLEDAFVSIATSVSKLRLTQ